MKALCLLLILANISLFLWEYRGGGFIERKEPSTQLANPGVETIFLANEVEQDSELVVPEENQAEQVLEPEPANTTISQPQPENTATTQPNTAGKSQAEPKPTEPVNPQAP